MDSDLNRYFAVLIGLTVLCYLVFFHGLGNYAIWDPDEGRTGVIAKEMVTSGNWVTLTQNEAPYYDKPALYFWLVAMGLKLLGLNESAVRLPSALAASLTVGLVFFWGSVAGGWKRGLLGAVVLATSMEFVALGRFGKMDMVFTFFFTAALLSFLWWKKQGQGWIWLFYLFMALAVLIKGPIGALLPLLVVAVALGLKKRWDLLWEMRLDHGLVVLMLVSGPWYLLAALRDPQYIWTFLWDHNVARYFVTEPGIKHPQPVYYFLPILIGGFLPWSLFLPPMVYGLWRERKEASREEISFLWVWIITVLIFFSLARNKLGVYILPAFPLLALWTGDFLCQSLEARETRPWLRIWILCASFFWLLSILFLSPLSELFLSHRYPQYLPLNLPLFPVAFFVVLSLVGWVLKKEVWAPWIVSFSSIWLVLWFYEVKAPQISEMRSTRSLAQIVHGNATKDYRMVAIRAESLSFYLPHRVQAVSHPAEIESMLEESIPTVALVKERHLREMPRLSPSKLFVWKRIPSGGALIANVPPTNAHDLGSAPRR